ncbi:hypothetical protein BZA77DRAFT_309196 [Pyronema omphalodes]|nr:hypothetical protein BZA77DRAFT_309196 [Pyronema omphalodes]
MTTRLHTKKVTGILLTPTVLNQTGFLYTSQNALVVKMPMQSRGSVRPSMATAANTKARQYAMLQSQLSSLHFNLERLEDNMRVTAAQADNIKTLGTLNAALLMSANKIFEKQGAGSAGKEKEDDEMTDA